jgi:hypothetical protein
VTTVSIRFVNYAKKHKANAYTGHSLIQMHVTKNKANIRNKETLYYRGTSCFGIKPGLLLSKRQIDSIDCSCVLIPSDRAYYFVRVSDILPQKKATSVRQTRTGCRLQISSLQLRAVGSMQLTAHSPRA